MRDSRAFTFAELLIGVTVSAIIMTGVAIFVGSGIDNAFKIRKGVEQNAASSDFDGAVGKMAAFGGKMLFNGKFDAPYGSGVLLKNESRAVPLVFLATKSATGICDAYSGTTELSGTGEILEVVETFAPDGVENSAWMTVDHTGHVVRDSSNSVVLWTGNPGNAGGNGTAWTATELRFPSAVADIGGGRHLVADSGNGRVLLLSGGNATTLVWPETGIRHPHEIASDGVDVRIAGSNGIFGILWNPIPNGSAFSGSFRSDAAFSFDSVKVTLWGARIPPSPLGSYAFDFVPSWGSVTVSGNAATAYFSGSTYSYSVGSLAKISIVWINPSASPKGAYQLTAQYFLWGVEKYRRTLPYFVVGDADPTTLQDDAFEITGMEKNYPSKLTYSWGTFGYGDLWPYSQLANVAAASSKTASPRLVKNFRTANDGKILTVKYDEYVRYDCLWWNHVTRERVWKIPLK